MIEVLIADSIGLECYQDKFTTTRIRRHSSFVKRCKGIYQKKLNKSGE